mmetsp:Transcript_10477/g.11288  ORF Transcript_10477/g.11288 Transcript_10477/m.11288 type:complete len:201 (-) Transcript_10477:37-639(-)
MNEELLLKSLEEIFPVQEQKEENPVILKFRNYVPRDKNLKKYMLHKPISFDKSDKKKEKDEKEDVPKQKRQKIEGAEEDEDDEPKNEEIELDDEEPEKQSKLEPEEPQKELTQAEKVRAATYDLIERLSKFDVKEYLEKELAKDDNQGINLLPKKINWDLKEEIAPKLEKLKKRTQKAIVEILREKYTIENNQENQDSTQ